MSKQSSIEKLLITGKKVFTTEDLAVIWGITERRKLLERINYYLREKRLISIHKGVYAYGDYTSLDIAQKLVPLSYLSLYTTSQMHGLTFQHYSSVFCVSLKSKKYNIKNQTYVYHKVKEPVFYSQLGLESNGRYTLAGRERTICDMLYFFPTVAFDNLKGVDWQKALQIAGIYNNKRLVGDINKLVKSRSEP